MTESVECVVIGAGVVGLAVARSLACAGLETLVLERDDRIGSGISARNSEVLHAGIYYPPQSLKARLCLQGNALAYRFCDRHAVSYRRRGKLVVASRPDQLGRLAEVAANAAASGVRDLRSLDRDELRAMEPELDCVAGLLSPSTGIVDGHGFMLALQGDIERAGGIVSLRSPVTGIRRQGKVFELDAGDPPSRIATRCLVNCAGLDAQHVAQALGELPEAAMPPLFLAKGSYFSLRGRAPFRHLVYPVPDTAGLGIHLTLDLTGRARFGPDVEWVDTVDYDVDPDRSAMFYAAVRSYWPGLPEGSLSPDYAGIRPKLHGPGGAARDFEIQGPDVHGIEGLVNLFGIESPGFTASLAIGEHVRALLGR